MRRFDIPIAVTVILLLPTLTTFLCWVHGFNFNERGDAALGYAIVISLSVLFPLLVAFILIYLEPPEK